jgi:hypothetical protein
LTHPATIENSSAVLEIKHVPTELILFAIQQWTPCHKYAKKTGVGNSTNQFVKGIAVWLILKNETSSGKIKVYRQQLLQLAAKCKMSVRTLDKYLSWLKSEDLLHVEGKDLQLHDYKILRRYRINTKQREQTIYYDPTKEASLAEILISLAIQKLKDNWMQVYWKKLNQNPDEYKRLYDLLVYVGADPSKMDDPEIFREYHLEAMLQAYKEEKPGQPIYDYLHKHLKVNPDLNCKEATYARKMGYTVYEKENARTKKDESRSAGFGHLKKRLAKKGLITVEKDHIESDCRSRKDEKTFHHRWAKEKEVTIWFRCDQITIQTDQIFGQKPAA